MKHTTRSVALPSVLAIGLLVALAGACGSEDKPAEPKSDQARTAPVAETTTSTEAPVDDTAEAEPSEDPEGLDCRELHRKAVDLSQMLTILRQLEGFASMDPTTGPEGMLRNVRETIQAVQPIPGADDTKARLAELDKLLADYLAADKGERGKLTQAIMAKAAETSPTALVSALVLAGCK